MELLPVFYPNSSDQDFINFWTGENINTAWAKLHQARYLAGVVAGGELSEGGEVCYIMAWENPEVIRGVNAFALGVKLLNPNATISTIVVNTWGNAFTELKAAQFLDNRGCEMIAQHVDHSEPQEVFASLGKFSIGSNSDTRAFLGEEVLTSPSFLWENMYPEIVQMAVNNELGNKTILKSFYENTVHLSSLSGFVKEETRQLLAEEESNLMNAEEDEYIFCGPIYDTSSTIRINTSECASLKDLGTIDWYVEGIQILGDFTPQYPDSANNFLPSELVIFSWILVGIFLMFGIGFGIWTYLNRKSSIIMFAQPFFLYLVILGLIDYLFLLCFV